MYDETLIRLSLVLDWCRRTWHDLLRRRRRHRYRRPHVLDQALVCYASHRAFHSRDHAAHSRAEAQDLVCCPRRIAAIAPRLPISLN